MTEKNNHTYQEIKSQPEIFPQVLKSFYPVRDELTQLWNQHDFQQVIFTGCGSTFHLSKSAAVIFQSLTGIPAFFYPGSELMLFPELFFSKSRSTLLVAVSRSGETTETLKAVDAYRQLSSSPVIAITCDSGSSLSKQADLSLDADAAQEKSVAQTRSFSSMLLLAQAFAGQLAGKQVDLLEEISNAVARVFDRYEPLAKELGENPNIQANYFLGSGMLYGIGHEAMLKLKEMSLSVSEAFHTLDFRHGPMSMVNENSLVIGLLSQTALPQETAVLRDMHNLGGKILAISEASYPGLQDLGDLVLLETGLPDWANTVVYLPFLQLLAYYRSISKGLDPDSPRNLDAVVTLT